MSCSAVSTHCTVEHDVVTNALPPPPRCSRPTFLPLQTPAPTPNPGKVAFGSCCRRRILCMCNRRVWLTRFVFTAGTQRPASPGRQGRRKRRRRRRRRWRWWRRWWRTRAGQWSRPFGSNRRRGWGWGWGWGRGWQEAMILSWWLVVGSPLSAAITGVSAGDHHYLTCGKAFAFSVIFCFPRQKP